MFSRFTNDIGIGMTNLFTAGPYLPVKYPSHKAMPRLSAASSTKLWLHQSPEMAAHIVRADAEKMLA